MNLLRGPKGTPIQPNLIFYTYKSYNLAQYRNYSSLSPKHLLCAMSSTVPFLVSLVSTLIKDKKEYWFQGSVTQLILQYYSLLKVGYVAETFTFIENFGTRVNKNPISFLFGTKLAFKTHYRDVCTFLVPRTKILITYTCLSEISITFEIMPQILTMLQFLTQDL